LNAFGAVNGFGRASRNSRRGSRTSGRRRDGTRLRLADPWLSICVSDRRTGMIITGGHVYPGVVVGNAAVVGLPDGSPRRNCMLTVLELASYKVPKSYEFVAELPRMENGKIRSAALLEQRVTSAVEQQMHR